MEKKSKIGVILSIADSGFFGYSERKGFFISKESFLNHQSQKSLDKDTLWFTNQPSDIVFFKNIKSKDFFDIDIESILSYLGYSYDKNTIKITLKKFYDFVLSFVKNFSEQFTYSSLEKSNSSMLMKRKTERYEILKTSDSYKNALISMTNLFPNSFVFNKEIDGVDRKIKASKAYNFDDVRDTSKKSDICNRIRLDLPTEDMREVLVKVKSKEYTIITLNNKSLKRLPEQSFFQNGQYVKESFLDEYDLEEKKSKLKRNEKIKKAMLSKDYLFFKILIKVNFDETRKDKKTSFKIFEKLNDKEIVVSKEECKRIYDSKFFNIKILEGIRLNANKIALKNKYKELVNNLKAEKEDRDYNKYNNTIKSIKKINQDLGQYFDFNLYLFPMTINEEMSLNKLQNHIHTYNYLQIILLNDNFLLNEWIKSQLIQQNLLVVEYLLSKGVTVSSYDFKSITLNLDNGEEEYVRNLLENIKEKKDLNILYPASLL